MIMKTVNRVFKFRQRFCGKISKPSVCYETANTAVCSGQRGYVSSRLTGNFNFNNNLRKADFELSNIRRISDISQSTESVERELDTLEFDKICSETLESLSDYFDEIVESAAHLEEADVSYRDGVLTVKFGGTYGTYVINRQTPNKQIWLSSPTSGPKRYDFIKGRWIYRHDGKSLHDLLNDEIPPIVKSDISFSKCLYSGGR